MKTNVFKKIIKEAVKEVFQEELKEILLESFKSSRQQTLTEHSIPQVNISSNSPEVTANMRQKYMMF
jgi:hypothetical protein